MALEVLCCKIFFETFEKKIVRKSSYKQNLILFMLFIVDNIISFLLIENIILKQIIVIIFISIFMHHYIAANYRKAFILAVLYQSLILVIDYLTYSIILALFLKNIFSGSYYTYISTLIIILGKLALFLCVIILKKVMGKKSMDIVGDSEWLRFLFFPIFTIIMIVSIISIFGNIDSNKEANVFLVIAFGMIGMNIVDFYLINYIIEKEVKINEVKIFEIQLKNQADMYRSISTNFDKQKRETHEFKNYIFCIESLLDRKEYIKIQDFIKNINKKLDAETDAINTNNVIVNAVLNTKYQEAVEKGIVFIFRINDLSNLRIKEEHLVIILSNLLNNAIEACERCESKKIIKLKFVIEDCIIISVKNSCCRPCIIENNEILTTKQFEKEIHGVGIKNVIRTIEKYNASYVIKNNKDEFFFSIIIPV
jgi:signal transduction histidine kinase